MPEQRAASFWPWKDYLPVSHCDICEFRPGTSARRGRTVRTVGFDRAETLRWALAPPSSPLAYPPRLGRRAQDPRRLPNAGYTSNNYLIPLHSPLERRRAIQRPRSRCILHSSHHHRNWWARLRRHTARRCPDSESQAHRPIPIFRVACPSEDNVGLGVPPRADQPALAALRAWNTPS